MRTVSRELREHVVHALAVVGVIWSLALLAVLFMTTAAHGDEAAGGYELSANGASGSRTFAIDTYTASPTTAGLVLVVSLVAIGIAVLAIGSTPPATDTSVDRYAGLADAPPADLSFAFTHGATTTS